MVAESIGDLPRLDDLGIESGFDTLVPFARQVFAVGASRFMRSGDGDLVVYRNHDLRVLGAMPEVGAVPPEVLFGPVYKSLGGDQPLPGAAMAEVIANQVFSANPPLHNHLRRTITSCFGPRQVKAMEELARSVAATSINEIDPAGPVNVLHHFTDRITCRFFGGLLGMDHEEIAEMETFIGDFAEMFLVQPTPDAVLRFDAAAKGYRRLLDQVARRGLANGHPLITALSADLDAVRALGLPEDPNRTGIVPIDAGAALAGNLVDGYHTAAVGIANCLYVLSRHPDIMPQISQDRSLVLPAIFEALRLAPPVIALKRWAIEEFVLDGLRVPAGTSIMMMWGIGGYDPDQFSDPETFVLDRSRQGSTTFGGGHHLCPGRYLAPMLAKVLLDEMFDRNLFPSPDDTRAEWIKGSVMCQLNAFELRFTTR